MIEDTLKQLNLNDKEIQIYLILLRLGQSTINRIAELTNYPKSTCYDILRSLISRGLASSFDRDKVKHFEAADPRTLIANLEEQKQRVKEILPELIGMQKSIGEKPNVELYEGKQGVKAIFDSILDTKKEFFGMTNESKFESILQWFIPNFRMRRSKAKIKARIICEESDIAKDMKSRDKQELRTTKIDSMMNNQKAEFYVFGDKVALLAVSEKEPAGILIENKEIANLMREVFNRVWKASK